MPVLRSMNLQFLGLCYTIFRGIRVSQYPLCVVTCVPLHKEGYTVPQLYVGYPRIVVELKDKLLVAN